VGNSASFHYGDYQLDAGYSSAVIDLLVTLPISDTPFADGLLLTNQARLQYDNSFSEASTADAITPITLTEPALNIKKGVIAADNPAAVFTPSTVGPPGAPWTAGGVNSTNLAATPINSNVSNVDAGDLVTFATVVENTGSGLRGAFDVAVSDTVPAGFVIPAPGVLNLQVRNGAGTALPYTNVGGGTGLFDQGIRLDDNNVASPRVRCRNSLARPLASSVGTYPDPPAQLITAATISSRSDSLVR